MDESDVKPTGHGAVRMIVGLLSRTGPEVPPDVADSATNPPPRPSPEVGDEPTELLPVVQPKVVARAVIVYEPEPRPRRGLLVFTGLLVALTVGVVLGQAAAYKPVSRPVSNGVPPQPVPNLPGQAVPVAAGPVTAPLGSATTRLLEVTGASALLQIRSADLGGLLFSVATLDGSPTPTVAETPRGPRLSLANTGAATDSGRTEIQLNSTVKWTIRLTGPSATQEIDMSAGGLAGLELLGGASHAVLQLPRPTGAVPLRVTGAVSELRIRAGNGGPVRLRLGKGADAATIGGTRHRNVKSGVALASPGWRSAADRYDVSTAARVGSVLVDQSP